MVRPGDPPHRDGPAEAPFAAPPRPK